MKKCNKCRVEKELSNFTLDNSKKDGKSNICKECRSKHHKDNKLVENKKSKEYYSKNRELIIKRVSLYKSKRYGRRKYLNELSTKVKNGEKVCIKCENIKNIESFVNDSSKKDGKSSRCRDCSNQYSKIRKKSDSLFKIKSAIRSLISKSISKMGYSKNSKTQQILGCSFDEFKLFIESKFEDGMSWDNYGDWYLDHKSPISFAKTEEDILKLNYYTNFQPLWKIENISKGNRYSTL